MICKELEKIALLLNQESIRYIVGSDAETGVGGGVVQVGEYNIFYEKYLILGGKNRYIVSNENSRRIFVHLVDVIKFIKEIKAMKLRLLKVKVEYAILLPIDPSQDGQAAAETVDWPVNEHCKIIPESIDLLSEEEIEPSERSVKNV